MRLGYSFPAGDGSSLVLKSAFVEVDGSDLTASIIYRRRCCGSWKGTPILFYKGRCCGGLLAWLYSGGVEVGLRYLIFYYRAMPRFLCTPMFSFVQGLRLNLA